MNRVPPPEVRRELAREVGFGCPVSRCGSPYLTWHHFDPPGQVEEHHESAGMVALCRTHHRDADAGMFTHDQLQKFKAAGRDRSRLRGSRFNWMHQDLLAVIGGNFYFQTHIPVRLHETPVVWFNRDAAGHLLVNLRMPTTSGEPRPVMLDNFWMADGTEEGEIECPPSGRLVSARYPNGDRLRIEFRELKSLDQLDRRYPLKAPRALVRRYAQPGSPSPTFATSHGETVERLGIAFPLASVEIAIDIAGTGLSFSPKRTAVGPNQFIGGWMAGGEVGFQIRRPGPQTSPNARGQTSASAPPPYPRAVDSGQRSAAAAQVVRQGAERRGNGG